jgi:demethoxyubiquinone hydroxylase (CLK1/Coq7/Cat5 family)
MATVEGIQGEKREAVSDRAISTLNSYLRGEISACETYRQALDRIDDPAIRGTLEACLASHEVRVERLRNRIVELGGEPSASSGVWGGFAKLVEGGATLFGKQSALSALEQGEDQGLRTYGEDLDKLDPSSRDMVERELRPAQEKTHAMLSALKQTIH